MIFDCVATNQMLFARTEKLSLHLRSLLDFLRDIYDWKRFHNIKGNVSANVQKAVAEYEKDSLGHGVLYEIILETYANDDVFYFNEENKHLQDWLMAFRHSSPSNKR